MNKRCEDCGRFMRLTNLLPEDDEFDEELAIACGFDENEDSRFDEQWCRFVYVQDQWECSTCQTTEWHVEGKRYYYDPDTNNYGGEKPLTPKEKALMEQQAQEAAGQLSLFAASPQPAAPADEGGEP